MTPLKIQFEFYKNRFLSEQFENMFSQQNQLIFNDTNKQAERLKSRERRPEFDRLDG